MGVCCQPRLCELQALGLRCCTRLLALLAGRSCGALSLETILDKLNDLTPELIFGGRDHAPGGGQTVDVVQFANTRLQIVYRDDYT